MRDRTEREIEDDQGDEANGDGEPDLSRGLPFDRARHGSFMLAPDADFTSSATDVRSSEWVRDSPVISTGHRSQRARVLRSPIGAA